MTIDYSEGEVGTNSEEIFNVKSAAGFLHTVQSDIPNMMRPMPFSGYPFQGKICIWLFKNISMN